MKSTIFVLFAVFACLTMAAEDCPQACTADYRPVCGETSTGDKRTFPNRCALTAFNCQNPDKVYQETKSTAC